MMSLLAQISRRQDMVFRGILIPVGVMIAFVGWRSLRRQEYVIHRHLPPLRGVAASFAGGLVMAFGIGCTVAAAASFFLKP